MPLPASSSPPNGGAEMSFHAGLPQERERVGSSVKFVTLPAVINTKIGNVARDGLNIRFAQGMT